VNYHLGISAYYHDSPAALVSEGRIVSAAQQERFSRKKHDPRFPSDAVLFCLDQAGIRLDQLASVSYYEDPNQKFWRTMSSFASVGPGAMFAFGDIAPSWIFKKRAALKAVDKELARLDRGAAPRSQATKHHLSHAASAFLLSPFEESAVLCIDGVGEWHTTSIWHGQGVSLELKNSISYPHSLGLLYSAFTYFCGFKVDSGEYKLMGLAPYGEPKFVDIIKDNLIDLRQDGSFSLNLDYFEFLKGQRMVGEAFERLFERPIRPQESELSQMDCGSGCFDPSCNRRGRLGAGKSSARHDRVQKSLSRGRRCAQLRFERPSFQVRTVFEHLDPASRRRRRLRPRRGSLVDGKNGWEKEF